MVQVSHLYMTMEMLSPVFAGLVSGVIKMRTQDPGSNSILLSYAFLFSILATHYFYCLFHLSKGGLREQKWQ